MIARQLTIGFLMIAIAVGLLLYHAKWIASAYHGPVSITAAELSKAAGPADFDNPWVTLNYEDAKDTGIGFVESPSTTPKSKFLLIDVGEKWLIAETPNAHAGRQLTGFLEVKSSPLGRKAIAAIDEAFPQYRPDILPFQLNAEYEYRTQCWCLLGIVAFLLLAGIFVAGRGSLWGRE